MSFTHSFTRATRLGSPAWRRLRDVGAAATAAALFGTVMLAPLSTATSIAFADAGRGSELPPQDSQAFVSAAAADGALELEISEIVAESADDPGADASASSPATASSASPSASTALYTLEQFMFSGVVNWGGYKFTFYSQQVLPGGGLEIPGRHVNDAGYVTDADGFVVLAGSAPKGTVYDTPFGQQGKIYDRGTVGNHLDVYIR